MKKYLVIIFCLAAVLLVITGCAKDNQGEVKSEQSEKQEPASAANNNEQLPQWDDNFSVGSAEDLAIGQRILVIGTENSDKSVAASQIIIGNSETDFSELGRLMRPSASAGGANDGEPGQAENNSGNARPDFSAMQNMSEEERAKFREEMMAQRSGQASGAEKIGNSSQSFARLEGEIINIDEGNITLKLAEGGSRIVFFSAETKVFKQK